MKKKLLLIVALACSAAGFAQRISYQEAQTRVIEPMQDVFVRPMAADLEIIKKDRQTYGPTLFLDGYKLADILSSASAREALEQAKVLATYAAAHKENADVIVGATYLVTSHVENGKISEYGVDITVNGYPARYVNWHKLGDDPKDKEWFTSLINGQQVRANSKTQKTEALEQGKK
jgi:hypothetical protein